MKGLYHDRHRGKVSFTLRRSGGLGARFLFEGGVMFGLRVNKAGEKGPAQYFIARQSQHWPRQD